MRIIKMAEFETLASFIDFFECELFQLHDGFFSIPVGHIKEGSLSEGEPLVFSFQNKIRYIASAATGLINNTRSDRENYPVGFYVNERSLRPTCNITLAQFETELQKVAPDINAIAGSQGWNIVPDSDQTAAVLTSLRYHFTLAQRKYGPGGEGAEHLSLKEWVYNHPEEFQITDVSSKRMEHTFLSGDRVDILFTTDKGADVVVEIETNDPLPGAHQLLKYRVLRCGQQCIPLESRNVRAVLVAWEVDSKTADFCKQYGITWFEKKI